MGVSPHVTTITLGRWSPKRLDATYPPTPGAPSTLAYLVLLRVEIARFTRCGFAHRVAMRTRLPGARLAPRCTHRTPKGLSHRLVSVALILTLGPCTYVHSLSVDSR